MYDEVGMLQDAFTFRIVNNTTTTMAYTLKLVDITTGDKLDTSLVKYGLTKNGVSSIALLSTLTDGVLDSGSIGTGSIEYALRLWIDSSVTDDTLISGKSLSYKLEITMEQEEVGDASCPVIAETEPNTPELTSGMIAVTYNETDKTWVKVDTSTNDWYDYSNQIWANAVTVTEDIRDTYMALDAGEPISMDDINTMWVWIPRYSYTIKEPYGRDATLFECSSYADVDAAITVQDTICIKNSEYTDEMRSSTLIVAQAMAGLEGIDPSDITDEQSALNFLELLGNLPAGSTYEDVIDAWLASGMLYSNDFYNNTDIRSTIKTSIVEADKTEQDAVDSYNTTNGTVFTTFEQLMFYYVMTGEIANLGIDVSTYAIASDLSLEMDKTFESSQLPGSIDITFISEDQRHTGTGTCETCAENWVTPEAFTFGNEELSGYWMAKFEPSGTRTAICTSEECTTVDVTIKPNLKALGGQSVSSFFFTSRSMQNSTNANKYGFDVIGTGTMDVHMIKNTEWGAVAYLSQSKYGKWGNPNYTGANKEIYVNASEGYITGMSNGTPPQDTVNEQVTYDTPDTGYGASTTGTIYGVYDMVGGSSAGEYVMGNFNNYSGYTSEYNSGFSGLNESDGSTTDGLAWPDSKYYDLYTTKVTSEGYKFGDATYETKNWYGDGFSSDFSTWISRDSIVTGTAKITGVFYNTGHLGDGVGNAGTRFTIKS